MFARNATLPHHLKIAGPKCEDAKSMLVVSGASMKSKSSISAPAGLRQSRHHQGHSLCRFLRFLFLLLFLLLGRRAIRSGNKRAASHRWLEGLLIVINRWRDVILRAGRMMVMVALTPEHLPLKIQPAYFLVHGLESRLEALGNGKSQWLQ